MKAFILSLLITPLLLLIIFQAIIFNLSFYDYYYQSTELYQSYSQNELLGSVENVLQYITGQADLNTTLYQEIEILHLADIKNLLLAIQIKTIGLAAAVFFLFKKWRGVNLLHISGYVISEIILAALLIFFLFEPVFLKFHTLVFSNDFWLLDPQVHLLIVLYPPEFFFKVLITTFSITLLIILISAGYLTLRIKLRKK